MENKFYITIGRQIGAGGLEVAKKLSKRFNIPVYDRELLNKASKESGVSREFFENADETPYKSGGNMLFGLNLSSVGFGNYGISNPISGSSLFKFQCEAIRNIAMNGSAIFVGRCADYVLREQEYCFSAFICANDKERIERLRSNDRPENIRSLSDREIIEYMRKEDKKRASYYNYYSYKQWGAASSYDMCLNSSLLGTDMCAQLIEEMVTMTLNRRQYQASSPLKRTGF